MTEWHDYAYDEVRASYWNCGALTSTSGLWGSTQHDHDANGHKVRDSWTLNGQNYAITSSRDAGGYLIAKGYSDGDAVGSVGTPWLTDEALRLKSIPGHVTGFVYNARGQVTQATYANGVVTTNTYNEQRGWLTRVETVIRYP